VGVLASRLPGWFHDSAATPCFGADFFPFFATSPFWFSVAALKKKTFGDVTALKRTMTNMTNTQIRPKAPVEAPTAAVKSEEVSRFGIRHLF
jgi:hypothetical protein